MKVFAISDLHLSTAVSKPMEIFGASWENHFELIKADWNEKVGDDDVVLLGGDFSWAMRMNEALPDFALFDGMKGKVVMVRGNHDYWWNCIGKVREFLPQNWYAVQNDVIRIDNLLICGTRGWVIQDKGELAPDDKKIYLREVERMKLSIGELKKIRKPTDRVICLTHFPPFNSRYEDNEFIKLLVENDIKTVVYGHLHGNQSRTELHLKKFNIDFYLTSCDQVGMKLVEIL